MEKGKCHICGNIDFLTNEHVPPRKAFNSYKSIQYSGDEILKALSSEDLPWDLSKRKGNYKQNGIGFKTLCPSCNNNTGTWYGPAFIDFIVQGIKQKSMNSEIEIIKFKDICPLRILKQIICMFFSVNNPNFSDKNLSLRNFILEKENKFLDKKYKIYLYGFKGPLRRYNGLTSMIKDIKSSAEANIIVFSEISAVPFGFVLELHSKTNINYLIDITHFSDYGYDEKIDLELNIPSLECNTPLPLDFRTKNEIMTAINQNK